ncbi:excinuclease ABC subunit UvrA [Haloferax mediterranei ATCC 33500]|uniref:Excinuclease ABC chain A n=1 Tax=Haloferax mediterranei (strain ATCC 33500 / DSM 1411 / JCM 8866 / NBRC 14739 / NCIMB 2177 / R-4) TaxID=523841 RepID=I3R1I5_HALMT|nr:excinuclease ABC subunit UvrA [Haloferax mediterranei]AFK18095.1 excinuclease ABC chain A [Haloferax mediterranei ATCC 33500]AHZ22497.1 excinuclease ABC subunit A [Haloferax mediterranei ATCC 33500]EMA02632.1 excinuclease ABC subunit A [Haloferax mediterranei ATCC 33500]MDX5988185.1 excinuclease ABC subunit UvrA [Haloferax mediterranei ATCC 33500]QCQ74630.1 excinuclease ABC subunit UvrA [Haloferax mediterranei ATCC 33500]
MSKDHIEVRGAEEHNLKDLDVRIPRETFTVVTGLSGSGKSSLAFDTVYAEGQRRYIESLSAYARNFLGQMDKPKVEAVEGLSPAISIDQKNGANNPRSTVGTVTELHDYLRLLYARVGTQYDPITGEEVGEQSAQDMVDQILELPEGTRAKIVAPVVRDQKGEFKDLFSDLVSEGYARVEVDGEEFDLSFETPELDKNYDHTIDVVVDRVKVAPDARSRIADSVETALEEANGVLKLIVPDPPEDLPFASNTRSTGSLAGDGDDRLVVEFSEELGNPNSSFRFSEIETRSFSFNSPHGACPECEGLGKAKEVDPDLVVTDPSKPLKHVFEPWSYNRTYYRRQLDNVADHFGVSVNTPFEDLDEEIQDAFLFGTSEDVVFEWTTKNGTRHKEHPFEGVVGNLERRHVETDSERTRDHIEEFMAVTTCPECNGSRLKEQSRHVRVGGTTLPEVNRMTIAGALEHFEGLETDLSERERTIAQEILKEIRARLGFMTEVGLEYLTLDREAATLSGGESQRIRLATQVGSGLVGVLYVLDEPSIGLHQRDNDKLLNTLEGLRDLGNTLIVVEHDEETMRRADEIIDMGPGPGKRGGEVVAQGDFDDIVAADNSITADYLSGRKDIDVPETRREGDGELVVRGARQHNLKDLDVPIPLGTFTAITGVSGSGKSTLMHEILYKGLARRMNDNTSVDPGEHDAIEGYDQIETVRLIDQSPIGRTPRSNPATYTGVFDYVRELFAQTKLSKQRGYEKGRFSFNVKGGRCEACKGQGNVKIEMNFLSDVYVPCEECHGDRYNAETLDVRYKGKTIADVLQMEVDEALDFFEANSQIRRRLQLLHDVGLGYMQLGQPSTTLSGGEAQRVKLAEELGKKQTGDTLYLLDEPTTGLHKEDERKLIDVLQRLADNGNTVLVVEHELDLVKNADNIIDLGPEGGDGGGTIVASGTPEAVARNPDSHTGRYLRDYLPDVDKEGPRSDRRKPAKVPNDD